ncbi:SlyX family protein [Paludibacterium paludis]|uniref:Protein SlyX homolog n=1 Tax=Paludibacterium paludis TaxID=1225769 RepID=A0A918U8E9_9NEIS|nr:SlyX family protein [Paludibacterium paludis]GGY11179.1 protein SlyX [Paludibacterium paludis]
MEDRIAELEVRIAFQDELLDALNQTVARQQREMDLLQQQMRLLYQHVKGMQADGGTAPAGHEIPPHY